jgi:hypothetical protein
MFFGIALVPRTIAPPRSLKSNPSLCLANAAASHAPSPRVPSSPLNVDPVPSLNKSCPAMSTDLIPSHRCVALLAFFLHGLMVYGRSPMTPRPTSNTFDSSNIPGGTTSQHGVLNAEDAHKRPPPDINTAPVQSPPMVTVFKPLPGFVLVEFVVGQ